MRLTVGRAMPPYRGTRPWVALMPLSPQKPAGPRVEPPPSEALAIDVIPAATLAAAPPLEPPGIRVRSHGLLQVGAIFV